MTKRRKKSKRRGLFNKRLTLTSRRRSATPRSPRSAASMAKRCRSGASAGAALAGATRRAAAMSGFASTAAGRTCRRNCRSKRITPSCAAARAGFRQPRTRNGSCAVTRRRISPVEMVFRASTTHRSGGPVASARSPDEPTGPARSGRPDDRLREIRERSSSLNGGPGFR
jgi:hypothetical protein